MQMLFCMTGYGGLLTGYGQFDLFTLSSSLFIYYSARCQELELLRSSSLRLIVRPTELYTRNSSAGDQNMRCCRNPNNSLPY